MLHPPTFAHRVQPTLIINNPTDSQHTTQPSTTSNLAPSTTEEDTSITIKKSELQALMKATMEEFVRSQQQ
jgi:hypothetical protein